MPSSSETKVPLRGYERVLTMADNGCMKIVHAMLLRSSSASDDTSGDDSAFSAFLRHLPEALVLTFNKHPRMRAKQVKGEFAMAEIQPLLTVETLRQDNLLNVRELAGTTSDHVGDDSTMTNWEKYAEAECDRPLDRFSVLPFYVRVWAYPSEQAMRVMLFSDHYMSDGISGLTVLNDMMSFAAELSLETATIHRTLPLCPSLYDLWMKPQPVKHFVSKVLVKLFGKMLHKHELKHFAPILPPRSDQSNFTLPVRINSSSARFGDGTPENMNKVLKRCKEENVTFFGALSAAVTVALYVTRGNGVSSRQADQGPDSEPLFKLHLGLPFNMRQRVPSPPEETPVGAYMVSSGLESFQNAGVDMQNTRFWDLARDSKQEIDAVLNSFAMPLPVMFCDKFVHAKMEPEFLRDVSIPHSAISDCDISNIGKYPFKTTHQFKTRANSLSPSGDQIKDIAIESVHVCNSIPHLGPASCVYVTSIKHFSYAMMHKYDQSQGDKLFAAFVASVEQIGDVAEHKTMADVAKSVQASLLS
ncbi:Abc transporter b family member 25, partial [Globisporangium splendens]